MAVPNINLPIPDFLNVEKKLIPFERKRTMEKHEDAFKAFCRWAAQPEELRFPKTYKDFEIKWRLPKNYTHKWKEREDFQALRLKYFWNWMFDRFPDVVYAMYKRAIRSSSADARVFAELVGKKLETDKPVAQINPFVLVGVSQEKIDNLFVPKKYDEVMQKTIELGKAEDAQMVNPKKK